MDNQSISFGSFDAVLDERIEAVCTRMFGENIQVLKESVKDSLVKSYLTIEQVAEKLGKTVKTIQRYERAGLRSYKIGRSRIYFEDDIEEFIESSRKNKNL